MVSGSGINAGRRRRVLGLVYAAIGYAASVHAILVAWCGLAHPDDAAETTLGALAMVAVAYLSFSSAARCERIAQEQERAALTPPPSPKDRRP